MTFKPFKLTIAYDGTDYHGWQEQDNLPTVTSALKRSFAHTFEQPLEFLVGASRTDAGVHALGQVARIKIPFHIDEQELMRVWNRSLPLNIALQKIEMVDELFHPQHNVCNKTYWYQFFIDKPSPFAARYGWFYDKPIDLTLLEQALNIFIGTHDFRSFATGHDLQSTVRTITSIEIEYAKDYNAYRVVIKGPSFVRYMIRRIMGACMNAATSKKYSLALLEDVLAQCNPRQDLLTAPAQGLILHSIDYR